MAISTITNTTATITAVKFNEIQKAADDLLYGTYGFDGVSFAITTGTIINASYWADLADDIDRCVVHQTGAAVAYPEGTDPVSERKIYRSYVNKMIEALNTATMNTASHHVSQLELATTATGASESTRITDWGSTLTHTVLYNFDSAQEAEHFFNLGGRLVMREAYTAGTGATSTDTQWMSMINYVNDRLATQAYQFTASNYISGTTITVSTVTDIYNSFEVSIAKTSSSSMQANAYFRTIGSLNSLDLTSTATFYLSVGSTDPKGIPGPRPAVQTTAYIGAAGTYVPYPTRKLYLSSSLNTFQWPAYKTSEYQTVTLGNNGNSSVMITGISYTSNGGCTAVPDYGALTFPYELASGGTVSFQLAYSGSTEGAASNSFTINSSNNDLGAVTVRTTQFVDPPLFEISLVPLTWNTASGLTQVLDQSFAVVAGPGHSISTSTMNITGNAAFTFLDESRALGVPLNDSPVVIFNPTGLTTATYYGSLLAHSTSTTGLTSSTSVNLSINYSVPSNQNLGTWLSPLAEKNAVVGMSYDTVNGVNYLTIGIGQGADGGSELSSGDYTKINLAQLGFDGDSASGNGYVMYKTPYNSSFGTFLNTYGVWIRPNSVEPKNYHVIRKFFMSVLTAGAYRWQFSCATYGHFSLNGTLLGDLRDSGTGAYTQGTSGVIQLEAGLNLIEIDVVNTGDFAGMALAFSEIATNRQIWTTLKPVRQVDPYKYWAEVYRIPLTEGKNTYTSQFYCIKDTQPTEGNRMGNFFPSGSMFVIEDDGLGNLTINFSEKNVRSRDADANTTLANIPRLPYYYDGYTTRYRQLENAPVGDGSQTHFFVGFDRYGGVRTRLVPVPTSAPDYSLYTNDPAAGLPERLISSVAVGYAYELGAATYNAYLIGIGAESGFVAATIAEAAGAILFDIGLTASIVEGIAIAEGVGVLATLAAVAPALCFTENTLIDMADGTRKRIIDVQEGEKVFNHDCSKVNTVTFTEYDIDDAYHYLFSPSKEYAPFATVNHPLIIHGEMYSVDPDENYKIYPWLGKNKRLSTSEIVPANGQKVYSLWVDGDNTFRVNGYGTHTIFGEGGGLLDCYQRGYLTKDQVLTMRQKFVEAGNDAVYGGYLYNNFLSWANIKLLTNASATVFKDDKYPISGKASMLGLIALGKLARLIRNMKEGN